MPYVVCFYCHYLLLQIYLVAPDKATARRASTGSGGGGGDQTPTQAWNNGGIGTADLSPMCHQTTTTTTTIFSSPVTRVQTNNSDIFGDVEGNGSSGSNPIDRDALQKLKEEILQAIDMKLAGIKRIPE